METQVPENMNTFCHILLPLACSAKQNIKWRKQGRIGVCLQFMKGLTTGSGSVALDKCARLIIRLLFGFVLILYLYLYLYLYLSDSKKISTNTNFNGGMASLCPFVYGYICMVLAICLYIYGQQSVLC